MANPIDRGDGGIVFYGTTNPTPPTYVDINGQTQTAVVLSGSMQRMSPSVDSAYFHVGGAGRFTLQVDVVSEEGLHVELGLVGHFDADPTASFGELATFRNDTQQTRGVHNFNASGRYILQTGNLGSIVEGAVHARLEDDEGDGEVIVRLRVER